MKYLINLIGAIIAGACVGFAMMAGMGIAEDIDWMEVKGNIKKMFKREIIEVKGVNQE